MQVSKDKMEAATFPNQALDGVQQVVVGSMLLLHTKRLFSAKDPMVELPLALFDAQRDMIKSIIPRVQALLKEMEKLLSWVASKSILLQECLTIFYLFNLNSLITKDIWWNP
jgi:hypothetical protein